MKFVVILVILAVVGTFAKPDPIRIGADANAGANVGLDLGDASDGIGNAAEDVTGGVGSLFDGGDDDEEGRGQGHEGFGRHESSGRHEDSGEHGGARGHGGANVETRLDLGDTVDSVSGVASGAIDSVSDLVGGLLGGGGGSGASSAQCLCPKDIAKIEEVLTRIVGPKLAKLITKIVVAVSKLLCKTPLKPIPRILANLLKKLLKPGGIVEQLVSQGNLSGEGKSLPENEKKELIKILNPTLGPYTSCYVVNLIALLVNGKLLAKLAKLLGPTLRIVIKLLKQIANPKFIVGKLIGKEGLGGILSKLLGAKGGDGKGQSDGGSGGGGGIGANIVANVGAAI